MTIGDAEFVQSSSIFALTLLAWLLLRRWKKTAGSSVLRTLRRACGIVSALLGLSLGLSVSVAVLAALRDALPPFPKWSELRDWIFIFLAAVAVGSLGELRERLDHLCETLDQLEANSQESNSRLAGVEDELRRTRQGQFAD